MAATNGIEATKTKFATIADLQSYIDAIEAKKTVTSVAASKAINKSEQEKAQAEFLEKAKTELAKKVQRKMDFVKSPPLFKKPAFYLDKLTPVLNVDLVVMFQNRKSLNDQPQEKRFRIFDDTNNHLLSFKYNIGGAGEGGDAPAIELVITDPKQEITEYLAMQMASLQTIIKDVGDATNPSWIRFEIEFGWYHNPEFKPQGIKNWDKVIFTNTVIGVFQTMETKFTNLGVPETTIKCQPENSSTIIFKGAKPFDIFGPFPAVTLCFEELNRLFFKVFEKLFKDKTLSENSKTLAVRQLGFFLYNNGVLKPDNVIDVIEAAAIYYGAVFNAESKVKSKLSKQIIKNIINYGNHHTNPSYIDKFNLMPEVVGLTTTTKTLGTTQGATGGLGSKASKTKVNSSLIKNDVSLYHTAYRSIIDGEMTLPAKDRLFTNYFTKAGTVIHNCFKIHPYYLYVYTTNYIHTQINKDNHENQKNMYIELWDYNADLDHALMPKKYFDAIRDNTPYDFRKTHRGKPEEEPYFINTLDVSLTLATSWENYLKIIFEKMYVYYEKTRTSDPTKDLQFDLSEQEKADFKNKKFVPLKLNSNIFFANAKIARKNIDVWIEALELRKKFLQENVKKAEVPTNVAKETTQKMKFSAEAPSGTEVKFGGNSGNNKLTKVTQDPTLASVDRLIKNARAQRDLIVEGQNYLINILSIKVTSETSFHVNIGAQMIAQVYSYRVGGQYNGMFNPGEPTCWDVNFPDVIGLNLTQDFYGAAMSVASGARLTGNTDRGSIMITNRALEQKTKLLDEATALVKTKKDDPNAPLKTTVSKAEITELKSKLEALKAIDPTDVLSNNSATKTSAYPINVTVQDYQHSRVYSGDYYNMLERKREVQNIRSSLIASKALNSKGEIEFLGDPTFIFGNVTNYWTFLKVMHIDGTLSILTGLYQIQGATHEISAGKFTTKFKIMSDFSADTGISEDYANQMKTLIYGSDKQKAYMGE